MRFFRPNSLLLLILLVLSGCGPFLDYQDSVNGVCGGYLPDGTHIKRDFWGNEYRENIPNFPRPTLNEPTGNTQGSAEPSTGATNGQ
jgi:hypothetical protein